MSIQKESPTWREVVRRLQEEIDESTDSLISKDNQDPQGDKLRGRIRLAQDILGWPDEVH